MSKHVAIVGAGVMGLLTARELLALDCRVSIFEKLSEPFHRKATSFAAGGMLAPYSELECADPVSFELGLQSLPLWKNLHAELGAGFMLSQRGSLFVSHARDRGHFDNATGRIQRAAEAGAVQWARVADLEPELAENFSEGLFLPTEAHLDNRTLLPLLVRSLEERGAKINFGEEVQRISPFVLETARGSQIYDVVVDCRGIGAIDQLDNLRGVRGEAFLLHAPEVQISRPIRLMHPRYSVYVVPRPDQVYYIGATSIEASSGGAVSVRSGLELLSAAYSLHKGFGEATLVEALGGVRPAFPDNAPRIRVQPGMVSINGLYRHGFLVAPMLAKIFADYLLERGAAIDPTLFEFSTPIG